MSAYVYQPYPAHRHKAAGEFIVVNNKDEDDAAQAEGWALHPSLVGVKQEPAKAPAAPAKPATPAPAAKKPTKAEEKAAKDAAKAAPTPLEQKIAETPEFDRTAAIARLVAANFDVDPDTTDAELVEALAELDKGE